MYLCFEIDEKRAVFPESSLVNFDENGFTVRSLIGTRQGKDMAFLNIDSFKGAMPTFEQAIKWVKRAPAKGAAKQPAPEQQAQRLPDSPSF